MKITVRPYRLKSGGPDIGVMLGYGLSVSTDVTQRNPFGGSDLTTQYEWCGLIQEIEIKVDR